MGTQGGKGGKPSTKVTVSGQNQQINNVMRRTKNQRFSWVNHLNPG
jgi:hypothetical protein